MRQRGVSRMASLEIVLEKGDKTYTQEEKMELQTEKTDTMLKMLQKLDSGAVASGSSRNI